MEHINVREALKTKNIMLQLVPDACSLYHILENYFLYLSTLL